jgi:chain length determinant protein EpsF
MTLSQLLSAVRARWGLALGVFLFVVALSLTVGLLSKKLYTATATVVADTKADPIAGVSVITPVSTGYIATQVDIISSQRVAERVVKILKWDQLPENIHDWQDATGGRGSPTTWLAIKLQKMVAVTPSRDSSVIEIAMSWTDPKNAALLANTFAQAYIDTGVELEADPAKQYATWFDERSRALRLDLQAKQKRLADFQAQTGIVLSTDGRLDIENARLAELSSQLVAIQAQRQDSQSRQHQAGASDTIPEVLQSPVIAGLKSELARSEAKLQDISTNLGKNHPDYKTTSGEIAGLKARIADETSKIVASLGNTTQVMMRRESDIRAALEAQKKRMLDLTQQRDEVAVLQDDVVTAQKTLDAVTQRLAQSNLESQTQQTNVVVLSPAIEPLFKSSPRYSLNLLMGMILGSILSVGLSVFLDLRDRRVREDAELGQLIGAPILGSAPLIKPSDPKSSRVEPIDLDRAQPSAI